MTSQTSPLQGLLTRAAVGLLGCAVAAGAYAAKPRIIQHGAVIEARMPDAASQASGDPIDYVNARAKTLPIASSFSAENAQAELIGALSSAASPSSPRGVYKSGYSGDGRTSPVFLGKPAYIADDGEIAPQEAGTSNHNFTTARADGYSGTTNNIYPFRAAGKLFFKEGPDTFVCSASLIAKGIVVTAAHCVNDFGKNTFYTDFSFVPGYKSGAAPYGRWKAKSVFVVQSYANGTDVCSQRGVVCRNDVAIIVLLAQSSRLPGTSTGWFGWGYDGAGFTSAGRTHITQIGYPLCLDNGEIMERNDSEGFKSSTNANNTLIGSLMCGGSSGGPWLVNFGKRPVLTQTTSGNQAQENMVVGTTSWGSTSTGPKQQGASAFVASNINSLYNSACASTPANCTN